MPTLSHLFGLTPADVYGLTRAEYDSYADAAQAMSEAAHG
jgi:hypothetical protein